ncbi:hypothetical protein CXB51_010550 [Gossypium anomalum]|uniref:GOLD domain-containing protein n=1 Tax=Gossypium anomalum TaxID=47600 RepID=A0A8J5Z7F9_9ROSI|nr:hypothetical protein CXB51_010550 [Gossypium anomalum]
MILRSVIMVVVVVGILSSASQALRFELQSGHTKCISEDIKSNSMTVGKYHVVNPNEAHPLPDSLKFAVRVMSPQGNSLHTAEKVKTGQFAFTTAEDGDYMACFWAEDHSPQIIMTVDFDWRSGVQAKDWSNVAKKGQVDGFNYLKFRAKGLYLFAGGKGHTRDGTGTEAVVRYSYLHPRGNVLSARKRRRNTGAELSYYLQDVLVVVPFSFSLLVSSWNTILALEDLL